MTQAGHPHPLVQRADGTLEFLGDGGFPVGLMSGVAFDQFDVTLAPGDRLIIVSDGVTECPDRDGTLLDEDGFSKLVQRNASVPLRDFFETMVWDLTEYADQLTLPDDVSGVLFEYQPGQQVR